MPRENANDREIVEALAKLAGDCDPGDNFVILEGDAARNYYIQFAGSDNEIYYEAVANEFLATEDQLDPKGLRALRKLGWREPDQQIGNWNRTFRPTGADDLAG